MHNIRIIKRKMTNDVCAYRRCLIVLYSMEKEGRREGGRREKEKRKEKNGGMREQMRLLWVKSL